MGAGEAATGSESSLLRTRTFSLGVLIDRNVERRCEMGEDKLATVAT